MFILVNKYITLWRKVGLSKVFTNEKKVLMKNLLLHVKLKSAKSGGQRTNEKSVGNSTNNEALRK